MRPLFVANWKMNHSRETIQQFVEAFSQNFEALEDGTTDAIIAPPSLYLHELQGALQGCRGVAIGVQNVHWLDSGAHTGEISPPMIREFGVHYAIVGHSERRQYYGETSEFVALRAKAALKHGIRPILCIGEATYFEHGDASHVVIEQLLASLDDMSSTDAKLLIVAYEPVWAIGTGRAATPEIIARIHRVLRAELIKKFGSVGKDIPLLYGGSTSPENIAQIVSQPEVNGALIGGASLKADTFCRLIKNGRNSRLSE